MKKSLIALAVLAASGAAMAQSSVQVYGIADIWFGQTKIDGLSQTKLDSGGVSGSRIGFKGTEDLGGGLKALFVLEQGFRLDDGAAGSASTAAPGSAFNREAAIGLAGGFGEVKFGKVWTALDDVAGATNSGFDSALSATSGVFKSGDFTGNPNNGIRYTSPSFGGFTAAVSYALGEDKNTTQSASSKTAFNLQYAGGPVTAVLGYQTEEPVGNGASTDYTRLGGAYDLGVVKLLASYGNVDDGTNKTNEYQIGADVPLSGALTLSGGYASSKTKDAAGVALTKRTGYGVALAYTLSKRTLAYTGIQRAKEENGVTGAQISKSSLYAVGIRHTF